MAKQKGFNIPIGVTDNTGSATDRIIRNLDAIKNLASHIRKLSLDWVNAEGKVNNLLIKQKKIRDSLLTKSGVLDKRKTKGLAELNSTNQELANAEKQSKIAKQRYKTEGKIASNKLKIEKNIKSLYEQTTTYLEEMVNLGVARLQTSNTIEENSLQEADYIEESAKKEALRAEKAKEVKRALSEMVGYSQDLAEIEQLDFEIKTDARAVKRELQLQENLNNLQREAREDLKTMVQLDKARLDKKVAITEEELKSSDYINKETRQKELQLEKEALIQQNLAKEEQVRKNIANIKVAKYEAESNWREIKKELDYEEKLSGTRKKTSVDFQKTLTLKQEQKSAENQITLSLLKNQELLNQDLEIRKARASLDAQKSALLLEDEQYAKDIITRKNNEYALEQKINKELDKKNIKTSKFVSALWRIGKTLTSLYTIRRVFSLMKTVVDQSSQWIENLNLFETAFGSYTSQSLDYLTKFAEQMGISNNQIIKVAGNFQELANTVGLATENSTKLSLALTRVGYDIASLRNLDFDTIFEKLQSVIYGGQVKTARTLGVNISAEGLEELAKEVTGVEVSFRNLSEKQKVLLRTIATFKQLGSEGADTFGDLGETITSLANRIRVFQGSFENLKQAIGDVFSDSLSKIVATGSAIIQAVTSIIRAFKPLETESGFNKLAKDAENAKESAEDYEETLGLLDLDKFSVLGAGGEKENDNYTALLQEEADKQADIHNETANAVTNLDEAVVDLRNDIISFIFPLSKMNEETGLVEPNLDRINVLISLIKSSIGTLIGLAIASKIKDFVVGLGALKKALSGLNASLSNFSLANAGLILSITALFSILTNPNLSGTEKIVLAIASITGAVVSLLTALNILKGSWGKAFAIAGMVIGAGALVYSTIKETNKFEKGGIPAQGSLFFAGEGKGAELLGNVGGRTNVINENQLGQVLYNSYKRANAENRNNIENGKSQVVLNVNGRELAKTIFNDINYVGKTNTGKSWGNN